MRDELHVPRGQHPGITLAFAGCRRGGQEHGLERSERTSVITTPLRSV